MFMVRAGNCHLLNLRYSSHEFRYSSHEHSLLITWAFVTHKMKHSLLITWCIRYSLHETFVTHHMEYSLLITWFIHYSSHEASATHQLVHSLFITLSTRYSLLGAFVAHYIEHSLLITWCIRYSQRCLFLLHGNELHECSFIYSSRASSHGGNKAFTQQKLFIYKFNVINKTDSHNIMYTKLGVDMSGCSSPGELHFEINRPWPCWKVCPMFMFRTLYWGSKNV